jgi:hypothetical protein
MTAPDLILADLPDGEPARELRFHLRSLARDLASSGDGVRALLPLPASEPRAMWQVRDGLAGIAAALEHDARHHAARAAALASLLVGDAPPADDREPEPEPDDEAPRALPAAPDQLAADLGALAASLARAGRIVDDVAAVRGDPAQLRRPLATLVAELATVAWPLAARSLGLARALHRTADPAAAADDDRRDDDSTPLREVADEHARELAICPHCGARLGAGDRTFDGSYCETCRTRYYLPAGR